LTRVGLPRAMPPARRVTADTATSAGRAGGPARRTARFELTC